MKVTEVKTQGDYIQYQAELINELYERELKLLGQIRMLLGKLVEKEKAENEST